MYNRCYYFTVVVQQWYYYGKFQIHLNDFFFSTKVIVGRDVIELGAIMNGIFTIFLFVALLLMGIDIDIKIVGKVLKRPIGPVIGFLCQFVFMPLCAYGLASAILLQSKCYTMIYHAEK